MQSGDHPRLDALTDRHAALDRAILSEERRPKPDETAIRELKRRKLRLKDEIAGFAGATG